MATSTTCLTAIFARAIQVEEGKLPTEAAQAILQFVFPPSDQERMQELALKNQSGKLTPQEDEEMNNYLRVKNLLAVLHLKARRSWMKPSVAR